jgi:predicted nucleic acid-binding protein
MLTVLVQPMKELFATLKRTNKNDLLLLDTCFLIDAFEKHKEHELLELAKRKEVAITSFNIEELEHVIKKVKDRSVKERLRMFVKEKPPICVLEIEVHPGNEEAEKKYVADIDPYLAQDIPDPSDAVLVATAIRTRSVVLSKDKHHLFTVLLENYLHRWGLRIVKDLHEI